MERENTGRALVCDAVTFFYNVQHEPTRPVSLRLTLHVEPLTCQIFVATRLLTAKAHIARLTICERFAVLQNLAAMYTYTSVGRALPSASRIRHFQNTY